MWCTRKFTAPPRVFLKIFLVKKQKTTDRIWIKLTLEIDPLKEIWRMMTKMNEISDATKKQPGKSRMWQILPELGAFSTNKEHRGKKVRRNCHGEKDWIINIKQCMDLV